MTEITTIFWDIGGVLLTNGWDRSYRLEATGKFGLDRDEFEGRHQALELAWDTGKITMDEYLDQVIFHRPRNFSREQFRDFMFSRTQPFQPTLDFLTRFVRERKYHLAALNNEPLELNLHHIMHYGLDRYFSEFFSSCFLGVAKPDPEIYRRALLILQRPASQCLFIDDRAVNLDSARQSGLNTIHYQDLTRLRQDFQSLGLTLPAIGFTS